MSMADMVLAKRQENIGQLPNDFIGDRVSGAETTEVKFEIDDLAGGRMFTMANSATAGAVFSMNLEDLWIEDNRELFGSDWTDAWDAAGLNDMDAAERAAWVACIGEIRLLERTELYQSSYKALLTTPYGMFPALYSTTPDSGAVEVENLKVWNLDTQAEANEITQDVVDVLTSVVDSTAGRLLTQERGLGTNLTADGIAYSGPCTLRRVVINTGTAGACIVYDNTAASGTIIATIAGANPGEYNYGIVCSNGIYINLTAGQDVTVVYEPV